jgi:hypothetical protein
MIEIWTPTFYKYNMIFLSTKLNLWDYEQLFSSPNYEHEWKMKIYANFN